MPIYLYECDSCKKEHEVLQKISDSPPTKCPACGKNTLTKQLTSSSFQLKGSGWYVTDFKGSKPSTSDSDSTKNESKSESKNESKTEAKSETKTEAKSEAKSEAKTKSKPTAKTDAS